MMNRYSDVDRGPFFDRGALFALVLGVLAYFLVLGWSQLNPFNVQWLLTGDSMQHWVGWSFFKETPLLQWPLGKNNNYGISSAVVATDSIPLLAIPMKYILLGVSDNVQYFGIWVLTCFMLQGLFAYKLLSVLSRDVYLSLLGCCFFLLAPPFLFRVGMHHSLNAQWLLIAAIYLYVIGYYRILGWSLLMVVAVLVHAYFVAMIGAIWVAALGRGRIENEVSWWAIIKHLLIVTGLVFFTAWVAGYFLLGSGSSGGFGLYRMNLLSIFNSDGLWSHVLPRIPGGQGDYEGFNFMGIGALILLAFVVFSMLLKRRLGFRLTYLPLLLSCIALTLFALSNHIGFAQWQIVSIPLPGSVEKIANIFRSSGRFFWPVFYCIYCFLIVYVIKKNSRAIAGLLLASTLLFQGWDQSIAIEAKQESIKGHVFETALTDTTWSEIGEHYDHIIFYHPGYKPWDWKDFPFYAIENKMSLNTGYFARTNEDALGRHIAQVESDIRNWNIDDSNIYILEDGAGDELWHIIMDRHQKADFVGTLNGYRVFAPNFYNIDNVFDKVQYPMVMNENFDARHYMLSEGWHEMEPGHVWSESAARLSLPFPRGCVSEKCWAELVFSVFGASSDRPVTVMFRSGEDWLRSLEITSGEVVSIKVPLEETAPRQEVFVSVPDALSPKNIYGSADTRTLGISLQRIELLK